MSRTVLVKDRWREEIASVRSLVISLIFVAVVFQNWELAQIWVASLGIHEIGHILAVSLLGIDWRMGFKLAGAWVETPLRDRLALSDFHNSLIHLAGPFFSVLLAMLGIGLHLAWQPQSDYLLRLANFSAIVAFSNLLPLGQLTDGGKFVRRYYDAISAITRRTFMAVMTIAGFTAGTIIVVNMIRGHFSVANGVWALANALVLIPFLVKKPEAARRASMKAMTVFQGALLLYGGIFVMAALSLTMILITPLFISETIALNMLNRWWAIISTFAPATGLLLSYAAMVVALMLGHELGHLVLAKVIGLPVSRVVVGRPKGRPLWTLELAGCRVEVYRRLPVFAALDVDDDALVAAGPWRRVLFALAGPLSNGLMALLFGCLLVGLPAAVWLTGHFILDSFHAIAVFFLTPIGVGSSADFFRGTFQATLAYATTIGLSQSAKVWMLLNVFIAVVNLFPLPALDGGLALVSVLMAFAGNRARAVYDGWYRAAPHITTWLPWLLLGMTVYHVVNVFLL